MKKHIHIMAVCGYTTAGLALMAKDLGYTVTGSDEDAYPPGSELLTKAGIGWSNSHSPENLTRWGKPDLVIQGNQIREENIELQAAKKMKIPIISDSEFFYELTKERERIVVCGTHGKTTVSALIAWILEVSGRSPGFRLGTLIKNFNSSVRLGQGKEFVFEGDEYTTTYSDKKPKFYYFRPDIAVVNNIEWDHPDVFKTRSSYINLFKDCLVSNMSKGGILVCNAEDQNVVEVVKKARCEVLTFGLNKGRIRAFDVKFSWNQTEFKVSDDDEFLMSVISGLPGVHNVKNSLAAITVCLKLGVNVPTIAKAFKSFRGTSRRFEVTGKVKGVTVVDDYAHHPTKARATISAARKSYPGGRIFAIYVPHTYSRTKALVKEYDHAFDEADYVIIPDIEPARERHLSLLIHSRYLVSRISRHRRNVYYLPKQEEVVEFIAKEAKRGDVILCMSVRGFDGLAKILVERLELKERR